MHVARRMRRKLEAYHAQVCFVPEGGEEYAEIGLDAVTAITEAVTFGRAR